MSANAGETLKCHHSARSLSLNLQNISPYFGTVKVRNNNNNKLKNNKLFMQEMASGNFKLLKRLVHRKFLEIYLQDKNFYNVKVINDIISNESTHIVAEFKDFLISGDDSEFLQKNYNIEECKKYLPKIFDYYQSCSVIFPNYVILPESKFIYKNIQKKQRVIDIQQEQEEKQEKIQKGELKIDEEDQIFNTQAFNSILEQTDTSNIRRFFGLKNSLKDSNITLNNVINLIDNAEVEANLTKKINLRKKNNAINFNYNTNVNFNKNKNNLFNHLKNNKNFLVYNNKLKVKNNNNIIITQKLNLNNLNEKTNNNTQKKNEEHPKLNNLVNTNQIKSKKIRESNFENIKKHYKANTNMNDLDINLLHNSKKDSFFGRNLGQKNIYSHYTKNETSVGKQPKPLKYFEPCLHSKEIILKMISDFNNVNFFKGKLSSREKKKNSNTKREKFSFSLSPSMTTVKMNSNKNHYGLAKIGINDSASTSNISRKNMNKSKNDNLYKSTIIIKDNNLNTLPVTEREKNLNISEKENMLNLNIYKINSSTNIQKQSSNKSTKKTKNTHISSSTGTATGSYGKTSGCIDGESNKMQKKKKGLYPKEKMIIDTNSSVNDNKKPLNGRQFSFSPNKIDENNLFKSKLFSSSSIGYINTKKNNDCENQNQNQTKKNVVLPIRKDIYLNIKNFCGLPFNIKKLYENSSRNMKNCPLTERRYAENTGNITNNNKNVQTSCSKGKNTVICSVKSIRSNSKTEKEKKNTYKNKNFNGHTKTQALSSSKQNQLK